MWKIQFSGRYRITPAQYDLTLTGRNYFKMFYSCEARRSFHTAWVMSRCAQAEHIASMNSDTPSDGHSHTVPRRFKSAIEETPAAPAVQSAHPNLTLRTSRRIRQRLSP
jgi:hypothetical protein